MDSPDCFVTCKVWRKAETVSYTHLILYRKWRPETPRTGRFLWNPTERRCIVWACGYLQSCGYAAACTGHAQKIRKDDTAGPVSYTHLASGWTRAYFPDVRQIHQASAGGCIGWRYRGCDGNECRSGQASDTVIYDKIGWNRKILKKIKKYENFSCILKSYLVK